MRIVERSIRRVRNRFLRGEHGPVGERLREGMQKLNDVLRETPFADRYWVNGGCLLGYMRNGDLLPHDDDADFSFWREDRQLLLDALPRLLKNGFRKHRRWTNNELDDTEWTLKYRGVKLEFFEMHRADGKMRWYCYGGEPMQELLNEAPMHGVQECRMLSRTWLIPDEPEEYLEALYGDWRTPNPNYDYFHDSKAIIQRRLWQGSSKW